MQITLNMVTVLYQKQRPEIDLIMSELSDKKRENLLKSVEDYELQSFLDAEDT